jgi:hypothetical protein
MPKDEAIKMWKLKDKLEEALNLCDQLLSDECPHENRQDLTTMGDAKKSFLCLDCDTELEEANEQKFLQLR